MEFLQGVSQCWIPGPTCGINWHAWAAVGTLLAVVVALRNARSAQRQIQRQREDDAAAVKADRTAKAERLAIGISHELYMLGGELWRLYHLYEGDPQHIARAVRQISAEYPQGSLTLTSRFADQLGVFDANTASSVMVAITRYNVSAGAPLPLGLDLAPPEIKEMAMRSLLNTIRADIEHISGTRRALWQYSRRIQPVLPEFDDLDVDH